MVVVKDSLLLLVIYWMQVVLYQEDTSRCIFTQYSGSWAFNAEEVEKIAHPFLRCRGE